MAQFDYFVIFAEMRTGSNFLEQNINQFDELTSYGEAFNPHFIGFPKTNDILGVTQETRDSDPGALLAAIKSSAGLGGFRYFNDHDPRVLDTILTDPRCAKIILTRNPAESYVSLKIAERTGQWKLTDAKARKAAQAVFDAVGFAAHVSRLQSFQVSLLNRLQTSGQTAFYLAYEDLQSVEVMNGLSCYLGAQSRLEALDKTLKVQNPSPLSEKVENFADMQAAMTELDSFNLTRTPNFEPRRGPAVPTWLTGASAPLLYMPIRGPLDKGIASWIAALDGLGPGKLGRKQSQGDLRKWLKAHPNRRTFTVLRHPIVRAHDAFCDKILPTDGGGFPGIRATLRKRYKVPLPEQGQESQYDAAAHREAFEAFLVFLKSNLAEQTAVRVDPAWATQSQIVQGFSEFLLPDQLLREERLAEDLARLAGEIGLDAPAYTPSYVKTPISLGAIYDANLEKLARNAYARDYTMFGFGDWA